MNSRIIRSAATIFLSFLMVGTTAACGGKTTLNSSSTAGKGSAQAGTLGDLDIGDGSNGSGNVSGASATTSQKTTKTTKTTSQKPGEAPDVIGGGEADKAVDLKGRVFTIAMSTTSRVEYFQDKSQYMYKSMRDTEKRLNCKFKIITADSNTLNSEMTKAHNSGIPFCDALNMPGYATIPGAVHSGMYVEISKYTSFDNTVWNLEPFKSSGVYGGKRYGIPYQSPSPDGLIYNRSVLQAAGASDPWDYVANNTWNLDTYHDILKKIKAKGFYPTSCGFSSVALDFTLADGGNIVDTSSGKPVFKAADTNSVNVLQLLKQMWDEGLLMSTQDIKDSGAKDGFSAFTTGKVGFYKYGYSYIGWLVDGNYFKANEIGWVWFPKGPDATDYVVSAQDTDCFVIPAVAKNPDQIAVALKDMFEFWRADKTSPVSLKQVNENLVKKDYLIDFFSNANNKKFYDDAPSKVVFPRNANYSGALSTGGYSNMLDDVMNGTKTPKQAVDTYKDAIQKALDDAA